MKVTILTLLLGSTFLFIGHSTRAQIAPEGNYINFNGIDQHMVIPNHSGLNIAIDED